MSIWDVPLQLANRVYTAAYVGSIVGAALTLISSMSLFWASSVRDKYADEQVSSARTAGETANAQAAKANERAALLEKEAADARLELARITNPRIITPEQAATLKTSLADTPKTSTIVVLAGMVDFEATQYATQIKTVLSDIGFHVRDPIGPNEVALAVGGAALSISVRDAQKPNPIAWAIQHGFNATGILMVGQSDDKLDPETILITVGPKF